MKSSNIITIVGIGRFKDEQQLICNATKDKKLNPHGSDEIKSWSAKKCPECQRKSLAIRIQGDSFMPRLPAEKKFLIRRTNVPEWLTKTLDFFKEYQVLSGFSLNQSGQPRDINFDLSKAFSNLDTILPDQTSLKTKLQFILPASATKIVVPVGGGALALAKTIKGFLEENYSKNQIDIVSVEKLRAPESKMEGWTGSVIVVTGLTNSPRELLAISRDLRKAKCPILYIIGLASFPSAQTYKLCCLDLSQRFDDQKNQVHNLASIFLSLSMEDYYSAWEGEKIFLGKLLALSDFPLTNRQYFETRQKQLVQRVEGERGLEEGLFLDAPRGTKLELNPNFSLVKKDTVAGYYNQTEVLFAVSATLHNIRFGAESEPNLFRAVCQRIVLSPRNFDRYNDAVIQAALLRLAHSIEIDYRFSKPMSDDIADIIVESARHLDEESSDALPEFLLALAMNRLRLHPDSLEKIKSQIEGSLTKDAGIVQDLFLILKSIIIQQPTRGC